ncbi:MAG TPA: DNA cytosine methyltransferase [Candidatus Competibacteraceae bacterium]|nr:DNA cytosine methyltransferase [Candidatus Competibacteraceae bacterium]
MTISKPDCAWNLADLAAVPQNGLKVMSTFACGGGSSMGYKRAGCAVIAANDIDPEMAWHYKHNLHPPLYYLCPIRDLLIAQLPDELFALDILDGSPPCSTFSMAGSREKAWGKEKHFREGQAKQVLSDLFFDYLDLVDRLKPKVSIAENVKGMIIGNAKGYTKLIMARFKEIGYRPQLFLLNAADCGVPQRRERVFFCALRNDLDRPLLKLAPTHRWISAGEATRDVQELTAAEREDTKPSESGKKYYLQTKPGNNYAVACERETGSAAFFNYGRLNGKQPSPTLTAASATRSCDMHWSESRSLTYREWKRLGSFPDDYHAKTDKIGKYMIGMSVPPKMTEAVARAVIDQWLLPE